MDNKFNLSEEQMNSLLQIAGAKLGTDPNQLKQKLMSGSFDDVLKKLGTQNASQINRLLSDTKALEQLLASDQARQLINSLLGSMGNNG